MLLEPHISVYSIATQLLDSLRLRLWEKSTGWIWKIPSEKYFQSSGMFYWRMSRNAASLWRFGYFVISTDTDSGTVEGH